MQILCASSFTQGEIKEVTTFLEDPFHIRDAMNWGVGCSCKGLGLIQLSSQNPGTYVADGVCLCGKSKFFIARNFGARCLHCSPGVEIQYNWAYKFSKEAQEDIRSQIVNPRLSGAIQQKGLCSCKNILSATISSSNPTDSTYLAQVECACGKTKFRINGQTV